MVQSQFALRLHTSVSVSGQDSVARQSKVFFVVPLATASGLAGDDQIETWHERQQLSTAAGLVTRVGRNASNVLAAFSEVL